MSQTRWGILISGRGSNLQTLLDWDDRVQIACVLSNKKSALGLNKARRSGIPHMGILNAPIDWLHLTATLRKHSVEKIFLLGFMKIIPENFIKVWENNIFNVHPSLLPLHPGLSGLEDGWNEQSPLGVTVHHVTPEMDAGNPVVQGSYSRRSADLKKIIRRNAWMERRLISEVVCR